jgi:putative ABC transport system permease protein
VAIPVNYIARNLVARRLTTALTAGGMALVVYVFATVLMLSAGLEQTLVATGQDDNVVVIRRGSQTEVQSGIARMQAAVVESLPEIALAADGRPLISKEPVVLINLPKRSSGKPANVVIRGVTQAGLALRSQVKLVEGRMFRPGTAEVIAGRAIASGFQGAGLGETLRFASRDWTIVGVFDAGHTAFDSEIWGDAEQMLQAFRRTGYSSLLFRLNDPAQFDAVKSFIESDPRLTLEVKREKRFYAEQSEALSKFISYLGTSISIIFSIGAVIGAAITMYASVASRTGEIGTLRALGSVSYTN